MKKIFGLLLLLATFPAAAQTKFRLFDTIIAKGTGITPAKGDLYYTSGTSGAIAQLPIGSTGDCLTVSGAGIPSWTGGGCGGGGGGTITFAAPVQFTVTGSGTSSISLAWQSVSQNYILAGPTSGSGAPTFRQFTAGDLGLTTKGDLPTFSTILTRLGVGTDGYVLTADSTQTTGLKWASTGAGTVTSVGLALPSQFTVTGSPVSGSGTLTGAWNTQTAHYVFIGPTSGTTTPTFRALVPSDLPVMTSTVAGIVPTPPNDATKYLLGDGTWGTTGGGGTVTSVAFTVPASGELTITGSPIIGSGSLDLAWASTVHPAYFFGGQGASGSYDVPRFRALAPTDLPVATATVAGIVPTPPNDSTKVLLGNATWGTLAGVGTVTSVGLSAPAGFGVTGSPVSASGTLGLTLGTTTGYKILMTNSGGTVAWSDMTALGAAPHYIGVLQPSGAGHSAGLAPDTPGSANTTHFLREDASWALPPQGTVTSVDISVPAYMTSAGGPVTNSGTLSLGFGNENANTIFAGPTTGAAASPTWRLLVPADYPVFIASGASHAAGAVPDPGITGGSSKFLREDASWQVPTFSSSIELKDVSGTPDQAGTSVLRFDASTGLQGTANGSGVYTVACTTCAGAGATAAKTDSFNGNSVTTIFTLSATPVMNGVYFVALNGLPQPTTNWSLAGSNVTMTSAPITGALLMVGYYTARPTSSSHVQEDYTGAGSTDFTLTYTPITDGVLLVTLRGLVQQQSAWTLIGGTTLRMSAVVNSPDVVSISYNH